MQKGDKASSIDDFFEILATEDEAFAQKNEAAKKEGKVLRYMASFENGIIKTGLQAVDTQHPFYNMSGSDNMVVFTTERYNDRPLVVKGPGAGAEVTAAGVFAEVISIGHYLSND